ncbi:MAG: hypothetical protein ACRYHQ_12270 [Janthinobacterium lividum]
MPEEVSALADAALGPLAHIVLELHEITVWQEWPTPANVRPCVQGLSLGHDLHTSGKLQRFLLGIYGPWSAIPVFHRDRKDMHDGVPRVQHVDQTFFHTTTLKVALCEWVIRGTNLSYEPKTVANCESLLVLCLGQVPAVAQKDLRQILRPSRHSAGF